MAEVSLTLTIHKTQKRVLWAETDKDFVDFLFCLFAIPMGQVLNFLDDDELFGCLRKAHQSVHLIEKDFLQCEKDDILKPKVHLSSLPSLLNIPYNSIVPPATTLASCTTSNLFTCRNCGCAYSTTDDCLFDFDGLTCRHCKQTMYDYVEYYVPNPNPSTSVDGFVKGGGVKYIVTDDLSSVTSKSTFSFLEYFKSNHSLDLNELEEKAVTLNVEKCKKLLKLAMISKDMVLTKFFKDELGF